MCVHLLSDRMGRLLEKTVTMFVALGGSIGGGMDGNGVERLCAYVWVCARVWCAEVCVYVLVARSHRLCINRSMSMVGIVTVMSWVLFQYVCFYVCLCGHLCAWVCVCSVWICSVTLTLLFSPV